MPFDEYMAMCLYDPDGGFFSAGGIRPGTSGDFVTSPEITPWFGRLLARWVEPRLTDGTRVVEIGAGSGSLLVPLVAELGEVPVDAVEVSASARDALTAMSIDVTVHESVGELPHADRIVIMNEILDNIPTKLVERTLSGWSEVVVEVEDGALVMGLRPADETLNAWIDSRLDDVPQGTRLAASVGAEALINQLLDSDMHTTICAIDYAADTTTLATRSPDAVVRTFRGHREGTDVLESPGSTDLTVEVNSDVLRRVAAEAGASIEVMPQHEFLHRLGAAEILDQLDTEAFEAARRGDVMQQLRHKSEATDLRATLDPRGLGGFDVFLIESGT